MNNYKSDLKHVLNSTFYWLILNTSFNLFGLWFSKLALKENFVYNQYIVNEFIIPIVIQTLIFFLCSSIFIFWIKKLDKKWYSYPVLQVILMHIAFFAGLKFAGGLHFETSFSHLGLRYLSLNGQYFVEFLFVKMPLNGVFSFESFKPASSIVFYLQWVLSICAYYTLISWLSTKVAGFFKLKTTNISSENTAN